MFSLDEKHPYYDWKKHIGTCEKIPSAECTRLLEIHCNHDAADDRVIEYSEGQIIFDTLSDYDEDYASPITYEITVTKIN